MPGLGPGTHDSAGQGSVFCPKSWMAGPKPGQDGREIAGKRGAEQRL